jgi:hypothetical protein
MASFLRTLLSKLPTEEPIDPTFENIDIDEELDDAQADLAADLMELSTNIHTAAEESKAPSTLQGDKGYFLSIFFKI